MAKEVRQVPFWDCLFLAQSLVGNVLLQLCGAAIDVESIATWAYLPETGRLGTAHKRPPARPGRRQEADQTSRRTALVDTTVQYSPSRLARDIEWTSSAERNRP